MVNARFRHISAGMSVYPSKWPIQHPDRLQLYSFGTPNGKKISIMLEEAELPYEFHKVDILQGDQHDHEYRRINPNGKIPTIIDPSGPGGDFVLMESGAILVYLGEKTGKFLPTDPVQRLETLQWLFFQMANVGPLFGQFGHFFKFARDKTTDTYGLDRYSKEARRLLEVMNGHLESREYLAAGQYTIADMATFPWVLGLDFYQGKDHLGYSDFPHVEAWVQRCANRPASKRGLEVGSG